MGELVDRTRIQELSRRLAASEIAPETSWGGMICSTMVRLSVMYPATPGSRFDWEYYLVQHRELSRGLLSSRGLLRTEIDRGIGGLPPGAPPPCHAVGHLFFHSIAELESALAATAEHFIEDERNYTNVPSVVQISEVVEMRSSRRLLCNLPQVPYC